ncbi:MAG: DUF3243 family protein [Turicibacter sp.]
MDLGALHIKLIENWDTFLSTLATAVKAARAVGLSEDHIEDMAKLIGDFLCDHVDPENVQQRHLKERWDQASKTERHVIAREVLRLVDEKIED